MITAKITNRRLEVSGHAPRGPGAKENLVCAAVSALTQTVRDSLQEVANVRLYDIEEESGRIAFEWDAMTHDGVVVLCAYLTGMRSLEASYPDAVKVLCGHDY